MKTKDRRGKRNKFAPLSIEFNFMIIFTIYNVKQKIEENREKRKQKRGDKWSL